MIFKTHLSNLEQIADCVEAFGVCFFHGDGNMYTTEKDSNFRKEFGNPKMEEGTYRIKFTKESTIPTSVEALNSALMAAKNRETLSERSVQAETGLKSLPQKQKIGNEGSNLQIKKSDAPPPATLSDDEILEAEIEKERVANLKAAGKNPDVSDIVPGQA